MIDELLREPRECIDNALSVKRRIVLYVLVNAIKVRLRFRGSRLLSFGKAVLGAHRFYIIATAGITVGYATFIAPLLTGCSCRNIERLLSFVKRQ